MKILFFFVVVLVTASCSAGENMVEQVEIYYIPIGVETYVPITVENIESSAARHGELEISNQTIENILSVLGSSVEGEFDSEMLRVKMIFPDGEIIYMDNFGVISSSESGISKLQERSLNEAKGIFERELGVL